MYSLGYYTWRAIYVVHAHNQFKNSLIFLSKACAAGKKNNYWGLVHREKNLNSRVYWWSM